MTKGDLKQDYFQWLCETIHADMIEVSYWLLMNDLHRTTFLWCGDIPRDENRAADGKSLREIWFRDLGIDGDVNDILPMPCTVLEALIGMAGRMDFELSESEGSRNRTSEMFWDMISNLGLIPMSDDVYHELGGEKTVQEKLKHWMMRRYEPDGRGGIFPLPFTDTDQRKVELWVQMQTYLNENYGT